MAALAPMLGHRGIEAANPPEPSPGDSPGGFHAATMSRMMISRRGLINVATPTANQSLQPSFAGSTAVLQHITQSVQVASPQAPS